MLSPQATPEPRTGDPRGRARAEIHGVQGRVHLARRGSTHLPPRCGISRRRGLDDLLRHAGIELAWRENQQRLFQAEDPSALVFRSRGRVAGPAFVEAKLRSGTGGSRCARSCPSRRKTSRGWDLQDPRLRRFPPLLRDQGILGHGVWQPVMLDAVSPRSVHRTGSAVRASAWTRISPRVAVNPTLVSAADLTSLSVCGAGGERGE